MLKTLNLPSAKDFEISLDEAKKRAESAGYKEDDVNAVIKSMWKDKRRQNCNRYKCIGFPVYFLVVSREKYSVQLSAEY